MSGIGRGKTILLGEHAVVYGHPALAASLSRGARAFVEPAEIDTLEVNAWGLRIHPDARAEHPLARAFQALVDTYGARPEHYRVTLEIELPAGAGLGGSAACGVAIADALSERLGEPRTPEENARRAMAWERVFHGNPSGIDTAISAAGGAGLFTKKQGLSPIAIGETLHLVIADSGSRASTKTMVEGLAARREEDPARIDAIFDRIASLVHEAARAIAEGDLEALGRAMDENHAHLAELGLSTPALDEIVRTARAAGALGAKLTGSGGGGCAVVLARDAAHAESIRAALAAEGRFVEHFEVKG
ncbi:MAG: mevalonate kinase [Myxococcales bacterium]|nr:mevalonate kinase [Myxococcales bacterium]